MTTALSRQKQAKIRAASQRKRVRERQQLPLLDDRYVHKVSVESKLIGLASGPQMNNFARCGNEEVHRTCKECGEHKRFFYACNRKWCPLCAKKLARHRSEKLAVWTIRIHQPKHLVLTQRNFAVLTRPKIRQFQKALVGLRRLKLWKQVTGGCVTIEVTNEGRGWHLHAHLLLDCRWLDMNELSRAWGGLVGQEFGIVKIKDVRGMEYLHEVSKYVCKSSQLASWPGEQIWEFICAIRGCRFFFAFGSLFKMGAEIRAELKRGKEDRSACECGCQEFRFEDSGSYELRQILADLIPPRKGKACQTQEIVSKSERTTGDLFLPGCGR